MDIKENGFLGKVAYQEPKTKPISTKDDVIISAFALN